MRDSTNRDMGAAVAALAFNMGDALYKDIRPGERFRFKASPADARHEKLANGQYRLVAGDKNSPRYRTGSRTAVFRIGD